MNKRRVTKTDNVIGNNIRRFRLLKGLSQTKLANQVNLTFQQIQKYEKGVNRVSGDRLVKFSRIFGVTLATLCGVTENGQATLDDPCAELGQTNLGLDLARAFRKLPQRQRIALVNFAESIVE